MMIFLKLPLKIFKKDYEIRCNHNDIPNKIAMAYGQEDFLKKCISSKVSGIICVRLVVAT